jgi:dienelactone hydrolase
MRPLVPRVVLVAALSLTFAGPGAARQAPGQAPPAATDARTMLGGRSFLFDYGQMVIGVRYLSERTLAWEQVKGPEAGLKAEEEYGFAVVRPDVYFVWWQEKDTSIVTQVVDVEKGVVHTTWTSPDKKLAAFRGTVTERVSFPTSDGGIVHADLYGTGERAVVLAHGGRFQKPSWEKQARVLVDAGFRVLAIDFRGRGQSRGGPAAGSGDEGLRYDVLAAVRYLQASGAKTVSVVGASLGGGAAAEASVEAKPGEIDRLVLLAHSTIEHPERMKGRKLFITARDDPRADGSPRLIKIREQFERAPEPKELVILEGSAHAQFVFDTDQGDRLMREILRFLSAP